MKDSDNRHLNRKTTCWQDQPALFTNQICQKGHHTSNRKR